MIISPDKETMRRYKHDLICRWTVEAEDENKIEFTVSHYIIDDIGNTDCKHAELEVCTIFF